MANPAKSECTCAIRYMDSASTYAKIDHCPMHAAAPDMLEALKAIIERPGGDREREHPILDAVSMGAKAIAKAEGK